MREPIWVLDELVTAIHAEQLAEHGGQIGIRDPGLLQSALSAPKNAYLYDKAPIFKLAAIYGYRICNNHPFFDGNKRTAYVVSRLFLILNGYDLKTAEGNRVQMFLDISANIKSEDDLSKWFEEVCIKKSPEENSKEKD